MTVPAGIPTSVGLAQVLHRAALAVECVDAVTDQLARNPVRVGRETAGPVVDLDATAAGRFVLRHRPSLPNTVTLRLADPDRRFVPRRLRVPLWTLAEVALAEANPPGAYVPVRSRLVRAWLSPGSAYDRPGGATAIRGRVTMAGAPVRWPRVTALDGALPVGWAHGDERGEFLLVVADSRAEFPATMEVDLLVRARDPAQLVAPDPADPLRRPDGRGAGPARRRPRRAATWTTGCCAGGPRRPATWPPRASRRI